MTVRLDWRGPAVQNAVHEAARLGLDDRTKAAAEYARRNHPGWKNVTGAAEASIRAEPAVNGIGRVGSDLDYFIWLELKNGSALRHAGDVEFPLLPADIAKHFEKLAPK